MSAAKIPGADYVPYRQDAARTRAEWRELIAQHEKTGGFRRFERDCGETFIHGPDARIRHEIYANVSA